MPMQFLKISFFPLLLVLATGCGASKKSNTMTDVHSLDGTWEANYLMPTSAKSFDELFPGKKPSITFDSRQGKAGGMSGCNQFNCSFSIDGNAINFGESMAVTKKNCVHGQDGEQAFLETLKRINKYSIAEDGKTLNLLQGDIAVMRLVRR